MTGMYNTSWPPCTAVVRDKYVYNDSKPKNEDPKPVWLANDSAGARGLKQLYDWEKHLEKEGKKFGDLVIGTKSWLIVKSQQLTNDAKQIFGEEINITTEGKRRLGQ